MKFSNWFLDARANFKGWFVWAVYLLVVLILVGLQPNRRNITHHYRHAAENWWAGKDLYTAYNMGGFLYFPQSVYIYTPYTWPPKVIGELLWRITSLGLYAWGVWRLAKFITPAGTPRFFFIVTLLTIPASLSSARSGQFNMPLAALMIHSVLDIAMARWNRAATWLTLSVILKPQGLVLFLLAGALIPALRWKLLLGAILTILLPFTHPDWHYVIRQHKLCWDMLTVASHPIENNFCDLEGLLRKMGFNPTQFGILTTSAIASVATLGLCWKSFKKFPSEIHKAIILLSFSSVYLMIFNPRTETNSYVILSPILAILSVQQGILLKKKSNGIFLGVMALMLGCDSYGDPIYPMTNIWLKPFLAATFLIWLVYNCFNPNFFEEKKTS